MSYNRRNNQPTSYDESVITAMAVVPQNNNKNVSTMYHPVVEGVNPSGSNVACLNKCMKLPSNFTMEEGTEVLLVNMSSTGSMIMNRYQFNEYGHLVKVDGIKSPFDTTQYRLQKPVSGVIKVYCNTITGTDFTLSGQVSCLALYDLPSPIPNYEELAKYSIMPTFSRINVSLEDGVALVQLPVPTDFSTAPTNSYLGEYITVQQAITEEPIITGKVNAPGNAGEIENWNIVRLPQSFYTCGTTVCLSVTGLHNRTLHWQVRGRDGSPNRNDILVLAESTLAYLNSTTRTFVVPSDIDELEIWFAAEGANPFMVEYSLYSMDPLMYKDSDLKQLVYIQGSLSPKNIIVAGEIRKQIVPQTEFIPVTEMKLPVPYDPKVFEACAMLAQMPDYGIVMKRSEYERISLVTLDGVASVSNGECGIADYWKMAVAALKKVGIKPAQLGRKLLDAGQKYGKNLLDYAESQGFAEDADEESYDLRFGTCSDGDEDTESIVLEEEDFCVSPERGAAETQPKFDVPTPPRTPSPSNIQSQSSPKTPKIPQQMVNVIKTVNGKIEVHGKPVFQQGIKEKPMIINVIIQLPNFNSSQIPIIKNVKVDPSRLHTHSQTHMARKSPSQKRVEHEKMKKTDEVKPKRGPAGDHTHGHKSGMCMDADEEMNDLDFGNFDIEDEDDEDVQQIVVAQKPEDQVLETIELKDKLAKNEAPKAQFDKTEIAPVEVKGVTESIAKNVSKLANNKLKLTKEEYNYMAIFKYNGGWKDYVSNLYASTSEGRLKWKEIVENHQTKGNVKAKIVTQNMVTAKVDRKSFQPFIIQSGKVPLMGTVIVYFTEKLANEDQYFVTFMDGHRVYFAVNRVMQTQTFGVTTYNANGTSYNTEGGTIAEVLYGTSQWKALIDKLNANLKKLEKHLYIVVDFDTDLESLTGGSFLGALDCAMFGECPYIFVEYSFSYFKPSSWPTLVGKDFKQLAFDPRIAKTFLPSWWPTSIPVSVWYETPKSFASWYHTAAAKPVPFSNEVAADITAHPIMAGPIDRQWLFKFSPPQIFSFKEKFDKDYFDKLLSQLKSYQAPSKEAQARFNKNLATVMHIIENAMDIKKWQVLEDLVTPAQASVFDAVKYGMKSAVPAALGGVLSLLQGITSVNFIKQYSRKVAFDTWLRNRNIDRMKLTESELANYKKQFKAKRSSHQDKKSKDLRKIEMKEKSNRLVDQLAAAKAKKQVVEFTDETDD